MKSAWKSFVLCVSTSARPFFLLGGLAVASQLGCAVLSLDPHKDTLDPTPLKAAGYDPSSMAALAMSKSVPDMNVPQVVLEVHQNGTHMERIPMPTNRPWFIEDLIEEAQLVKKLGRMNIAVMRHNGQGNPPLRLEVDMTGDGKKIDPGQNYALHPGDVIVVRPDNRSFIDRMVPGVLRSRMGK